MNDPFMEKQDKYEGISPLLLLGIAIFAGPHLMNAFGGHLPGWISVFGIFVILAGAGHTIMIKLR